MPTRSQNVLPRSFYDRDVTTVARELLGKYLVRKVGRRRMSGLIVEVEAYLHAEDRASHSFRGPTRRNASMFGPPGHAYVYTIHTRYCMNVVAEAEQRGAAVLIRAIEPREGEPQMIVHRGPVIARNLTNGPGKLCQALSINRDWDGWDLTLGRGLWIEDGVARPAWELGVSSRIGISQAQELALRFFIRGNPYVSGSRRQSS
jgi:DNA-3-methyladenine glycosylase